MKQIIAGIYLLLSLSVFSLNAAEQFIYTRITFHDGLTSRVNSIYKEKDGDVWIGTPVGLFSFDGYTLKNHTDKLLKSRKVFDVSKDHDGNLWVLTEKHILVKKDGSDRFTQISHIPEPYFQPDLQDRSDQSAFFRRSDRKQLQYRLCEVPKFSK